MKVNEQYAWKLCPQGEPNGAGAPAEGDTSPLPGLAHANVLILWDGYLVCALFESVVASQLSPPVGEQGKQDFTQRPSAERLPAEAGRSRVGPDMKENGASL